MYSLGKAMNDSDSYYRPPAGAGDRRAEWGPSADDVRHRVSAGVDLGLTRGFAVVAHYLGTSGKPYDVTVPADRNGDGLLNDRPDGVGRNAGRGAWQHQLDIRLVWSKTWRPGGQEVTVAKGSAFDSATRTYGSRKGGINAFVQATNVLNRLNPAAYVGALGSTLYGTPIAALPARRIEAGASLEF